MIRDQDGGGPPPPTRDRRDIMINMRDRRQDALEQLHEGVSYSLASRSHDTEDQETHFTTSGDAQTYVSGAVSQAAAAQYEQVFYNSFKRRQVELEQRKKSIQGLMKCLYLVCSGVLIVGFALFMNSNKVREVVFSGNMFGRSSNSKSRSVTIPGSATKRQRISGLISSRYESIKAIVVPLSGEGSFINEYTPQSKALLWLSNTDPLKLAPSPTDTPKIIQRYALACIYYASNGDQWKNSFNFLSEKPECEWNDLKDQGVIEGGAGGCEENEIKILKLSNNNLQGHIPREISLLKGLRIISLSDNKLKGVLAPSIKELSALKTLYIHGNFLTGKINFMCHGDVIENIRADCHGDEMAGSAGEPEIICDCCTFCCSREGDCYQVSNEP